LRVRADQSKSDNHRGFGTLPRKQVNSLLYV
jgi:hypothetical protein